MSKRPTAAWLNEVIASHAAIRRVQRLQPAGGAGDKIFPPTYPARRGEPRGTPPRHVFERRRIQDREVWCVLIDSVQSPANRLEQALATAAEEGVAEIPYVTVDFSGSGLEPIERITSLDAPHRVYDAILRDSQLGSEQFMQSAPGRRLGAARPSEATALLELSPTALLFGAWHSHGEGGGLGPKFARALVSEIIGIDTPVDEVVNRRTDEREARTAGQRTGSRLDPLGVSRNVPIFEEKAGWSHEKKTGKAKQLRPSEKGHGNIAPTVAPLGVTCAYAEHRTVLTLAGLRRLKFGANNDQRNTAGRALIAALGLLAVEEQKVRGYALRSRCDLVCEGQAGLELVAADGSTETVQIGRDETRALYSEAYAQAKETGFNFEWITLTPQEKLVHIVRESRERALKGAGDTEDEEQ